MSCFPVIRLREPAWFVLESRGRSAKPPLALVACIVATLAVAPAARGGCEDLFGTVGFPAGDGPISVTTGDLDGDADLDLDVVSKDVDNVSIMLGHGAGGFSGPTNFPAGNGPISVTTGDFNGDGDLDLAVANNGFGSNNVSILLGDGAGGFTGPTNFPAGDQPQSVTTGDFDGDGDLD